MNRSTRLLLLPIAALAAFAQTTLLREAKLSPAERSIAQAKRLIEKRPKDYEAYNALAFALSRRARETSDVKYYDEAADALKQSFAISPDNFGAARIHTWLLLGKHEFPAALEEAKKLNKRMPDDITTTDFSPTPISSWETTEMPRRLPRQCWICVRGICPRYACCVPS